MPERLNSLIRSCKSFTVKGSIPEKRLVQQDERRLQGQRPRNLQPPPLATGKHVSLAVAHGFKAHLRQKLFQAVALLLGSQGQGFQNRQQVVFRGELPKTPKALAAGS